MYVFKLLAISYFFIKYSLKMDFLQKMSIPRHSTEHFILGSYVHLLLQLVQKWNINPNDIFLNTNIDLDRLNELNYKVNISDFKTVIRNCITLTQEPGLGFYAAKELKISSHGLLGLTAVISNDVKDALETINKFVKIQCTFINLDLYVEKDLSYYEITYEDGTLDWNNPLDVAAYEFCFGFFLVGFVSLARIFFPSFKPIINLECECPQYFTHFHDLLSSTFEKINYNQKNTCLITSSHILNNPLIMADPLTSKKLQVICENELNKISKFQEIQFRVKNALYDDLNGLLNLEQVAKKLNLTKRTLQRMLKEKGYNFQKLYKEVREEKLVKFLKNQVLSREEIAKKLGYSNTSTFNRARKKIE